MLGRHIGRTENKDLWHLRPSSIFFPFLSLAGKKKKEKNGKRGRNDKKLGNCIEMKIDKKRDIFHHVPCILERKA